MKLPLVIIYHSTTITNDKWYSVFVFQLCMNQIQYIYTYVSGMLNKIMENKAALSRISSLTVNVRLNLPSQPVWLVLFFASPRIYFLNYMPAPQLVLHFASISRKHKVYLTHLAGRGTARGLAVTRCCSGDRLSTAWLINMICCGQCFLPVELASGRPPCKPRCGHSLPTEPLNISSN